MRLHPRRQTKSDRLAGIRSEHPRFIEAVRADLEVFVAMTGGSTDFGSRLAELGAAISTAWSHDAFFGMCCYRAKARLQQMGVPILPRIAHRVAMSTAQICIGDPVTIRPGIYVPHGQIVIDGITRIEARVVVRPFVTIGLQAGNFFGPTIGRGVQIGTGAKVFGQISVGAGANIGANAVVNRDVERGTTVVGMPARAVGE